MEIYSKAVLDTSFSSVVKTGGPRDAKAAAKEFEALLIGHLLQSAFSSNEGILSGGGDSGQQTMQDFGREHLARVMAQGGGFGLAAVIEAGLARDKSGR